MEFLKKNFYIIEAIKSKVGLSFKYDNIARKVYPHAYGISKSDKRKFLLRGIQYDGGHTHGDPKNPVWRLYEVDKIKNIKIEEDDRFKPFEGYKMNDSAMRKIIEQIKIWIV